MEGSCFHKSHQSLPRAIQLIHDEDTAQRQTVQRDEDEDEASINQLTGDAKCLLPVNVSWSIVWKNFLKYSCLLDKLNLCHCFTDLCVTIALKFVAFLCLQILVDWDSNDQMNMNKCLWMFFWSFELSLASLIQETADNAAGDEIKNCKTFPEPGERLAKPLVDRSISPVRQRQGDGGMQNLGK